MISVHYHIRNPEEPTSWGVNIHSARVSVLKVTSIIFKLEQNLHG